VNSTLRITAAATASPIEPAAVLVVIESIVHNFSYDSKDRNVGCEGTVSKRLGSSYRSGRSRHWVKVKNPAAPAMRREA
jgi:hypothetical protein